jgi:hypothetical protein
LGVPNLEGPIPIRALRDLLGLVRVMYADWSTSGAGPIELEELRGIGESLHIALSLAAKTKPNTMGHRTAWARAEEATRQLGTLVSRHASLLSTVRAASARVVGAPPPPPKFDPNEKVRERFKRG